MATTKPIDIPTLRAEATNALIETLRIAAKRFDELDILERVLAQAPEEAGPGEDESPDEPPVRVRRRYFSARRVAAKAAAPPPAKAGHSALVHITSPKDAIMAVVASEKRFWTIEQITDAVRDGGFNFRSSNTPKDQSNALKFHVRELFIKGKLRKTKSGQRVLFAAKINGGNGAAAKKPSAKPTEPKEPKTSKRNDGLVNVVKEVFAESPEGLTAPEVFERTKARGYRFQPQGKSSPEQITNWTIYKLQRKGFVKAVSAGGRGKGRTRYAAVAGD